MKKISVTKLKASLSEYIRIVRTGKEFLVTQIMGEVVAKLLSVSKDISKEDHLNELTKAMITHMFILLSYGKDTDSYNKKKLQLSYKGS